MEANPIDPAWDAYFENRHRERLLAKHQETSQNARLLKRQKGLCAHCGQRVETGYHKHHVVSRTQGGTDLDDNLIVIHHMPHPAKRSVAGRSDTRSAA